MKRNSILIMILILGSLMMLAGCTTTPEAAPQTSAEEPAAIQTQEPVIEKKPIIEPQVELEEPEVIEETTEEGIQEEEESSTVEGWRTTSFNDVATGESFAISDYAGKKKVLVESFAVWCSICKRQQDQVKELHEEIGDTVISIGLNTDPNENEGKVKDYIQKHGYDWKYAVAPADTTQEMIDEFSVRFVSAPQAPMILICEDQNEVHFLKNGVKSSEFLLEQINSLCENA